MKTLVVLACLFASLVIPQKATAELLAGTAKVDITEPTAASNDPLFAKALVLKDGDTSCVLITVDAVSIGGIGYISDTYLGTIRESIHKAHGIPPKHVFVNASHCHGIVCKDVAAKTADCVSQAWKNLVPVRAAVGIGQEVRIMENRRLKLKDGSEADVRHAYSMPWDDEVVSIGPVDPEIGLLRLDRNDGTPMAVVYNFACHPILGVPAGTSSADFPGFASQVIEENLGHDSMAFFVQGCAGDINPVVYKGVHEPHDCEPFGNMLGLNVLRGLRTMTSKPDATLKVVNESLELPRAIDFDARIAAAQAEQTKLLQSLKGTSLNFKTFVPLYLQYRLEPEYPSYYSHRYLLDKANNRPDLEKLDATNRANIDAYVQNIRTMEKLTRLQTNLDLLKMHKKQTEDAAGKPLEVEVGGLRIGDFMLVTFPGELTVQIGLNIKQTSPHRFTFVAGYTNGYIYYTPTTTQRLNPGYAQEDCDTLIAPEWQGVFETKVQSVLKALE